MWQTCTPPRQKTFGPNNPEPSETRGEIPPDPLSPILAKIKENVFLQKALNYYYSSPSPQIFRPSYGLATYVGAVPLQCRCCTLLYTWMKTLYGVTFHFQPPAEGCSALEISCGHVCVFLLAYQELAFLSLPCLGLASLGMACLVAVGLIQTLEK